MIYVRVNPALCGYYYESASEKNKVQIRKLVDQMKKLFYSLAVVLFAVTFVACSNDDHEDFGTSAKQDIEARAAALGFDDVAAYQASVAEQCSAGNHENCDIYNDGTHEACAYSDHSGKNHDGTHHNGTDHGTHDKDGHSHGSHDGKHH